MTKFYTCLSNGTSTRILELVKERRQFFCNFKEIKKNNFEQRYTSFLKDSKHLEGATNELFLLRTHCVSGPLQVLHLIIHLCLKNNPPATFFFFFFSGKGRDLFPLNSSGLPMCQSKSIT